jgi:hypothetical protein
MLQSNMAGRAAKIWYTSCLVLSIVMSVSEWTQLVIRKRWVLTLAG